jgi:hypothetical protein
MEIFPRQSHFQAPEENPFGTPMKSRSQGAEARIKNSYFLPGFASRLLPSVLRRSKKSCVADHSEIGAAGNPEQKESGQRPGHYGHEERPGKSTREVGNVSPQHRR